MKWKEVSVLTAGKCVEAVAGIFHNLRSGGVVIEDPQATRQYDEIVAWNAELDGLDLSADHCVIVKGYFPEERDILPEFNACLDSVEDNFRVKCKVVINEVQNEDWETSWKKYYHTFKIGQRLVIKPSWESYQIQGDEVLVEIDPGMAFGTGIHASTRFCLRFLDEYIKGGERVIDAGCGSGILSIAAVKLGAYHAKAMDIDEVAVRIARENAALNYLQDSILVKAGDVVEIMENESADIVMANITADIIVNLIPAVTRALVKGGYFFGSGIIESRWPEVKEQLIKYGFKIEKTLNEAEWMGIVARKVV